MVRARSSEVDARLGGKIWRESPSQIHELEPLDLASRLAVAKPQADAVNARISKAVPKWAAVATVSLVVASVAIAITAALTRGPWIDEFWTVWGTEPTLSWHVAFRERWVTDVHPPLF